MFRQTSAQPATTLRPWLYVLGARAQEREGCIVGLCEMAAVCAADELWLRGLLLLDPSPPLPPLPPPREEGLKLRAGPKSTAG